MKHIEKIILIGSGRRIQQDVIPVINELGFEQNDILIYANREKKIYVRDTIYDVLNLDDLNAIKENYLIYIAVPSVLIESLLEKIYELEPNSKIIVDTPIINKSLSEKFIDKKIGVAEDVIFLYTHLLKKDLKPNKFNFLGFYKSGFSYNAIAFIEIILSKIIFHFSILGIYFAFCKNGISIIYGKTNYERGSIWFNNSIMKFPDLNASQVELIGGLSDFDNVSYRYLDLKRIGLYYLIENFINDNNIISLKEWEEQYKKSEVVTNKYPIVNLFKIIYKKIF